jgi:hypothetical protein
MTDAVDSAVFGEAAIARAEDVATEQRFEALVIAHSRLVFRVAFAASRRVQDAEGAVQEVFFRGCLNCAWDGILGICRKLARRLLRDIAALRCCGLAPLMTLGDTLLAWREEIAAIWRFTRKQGNHRRFSHQNGSSPTPGLRCHEFPELQVEG